MPNEPEEAFVDQKVTYSLEVEGRFIDTISNPMTKPIFGQPTKLLRTSPTFTAASSSA